MSALAEVFHNPNATFCIGLAVGLWVAANVWVYRYVVGYRAGVKMCTEQLEPVRAEIDCMLGLLPMQAAAEEPKETRH